MTRWHWADDAACTGMPAAVFFPHEQDVAALDYARRVCARCPVSDECRTAGIGEDHGVWGGTTPWQRRRMRRKVA